MNKFEKHYYQYWKTTIDLMKCKIIINNNNNNKF
jgi:hypothetical protein